MAYVGWLAGLPPARRLFQLPRLHDVLELLVRNEPAASVWSTWAALNDCLKARLMGTHCSNLASWTPTRVNPWQAVLREKTARGTEKPDVLATQELHAERTVTV